MRLWDKPWWTHLIYAGYVSKRSAFLLLSSKLFQKRKFKKQNEKNSNVLNQQRWKIKRFCEYAVPSPSTTVFEYEQQVDYKQKHYRIWCNTRFLYVLFQQERRTACCLGYSLCIIIVFGRYCDMFFIIHHPIVHVKFVEKLQRPFI